MADTFHTTDGLLEALEAESFPRPPALVANAHVTGLSVARALKRANIPVIAIDRSPDGVAPPSNAVDYAGGVTYPLDDAEGFKGDVESIVGAVGRDVVAFACMDEWVHAFAETAPEGVRRPVSGPETIDRVLDKESLYSSAEALGVPYPETYRLSETDPERAIDELGFPLVIKPARKREFEEAIGTNVVEVHDRAEFDEIVAAAREAGIRIMAQERVDVEQGRDHSVGSYVPPSGGTENALAFVGNPAVRYPLSFGTSTLVERSPLPSVEANALTILDDCSYHGISEAEFVYDRSRERYVLLDINTRPWKWIGLPVESGVNLPLAAYASVTEATYERGPDRRTRWVYLRDYLALLAGEGQFRDRFDSETWRSILSGGFENQPGLTTGVYRPSDPGPAAKLIETEFSEREYYCAC